MIQHTTVQEVTLHYKRPKVTEMPKILCSQDAEKVMRSVIDPNRIDLKEFFWVILMSRANQVLGVSLIGEGTTNGTTVNIKEVFQLVITSNSSAVVLCHNHPSGQLKPSQADISITEKIKRVAQILDVQVLDHLIISSEGCYSMCDDGKM